MKLTQLKAMLKEARATSAKSMDTFLQAAHLSAFVKSNRAASKISDIFELIFAIALVGVGYPIALEFVFSANLSGWSATMKTLWTVGMPALLTLLVVFAIFEMYTHRSTG